MVDAPETDAAKAPERAATPDRRLRSLRVLDRRTVAICFCIAAVTALAAGLIASLVLAEDDGTTSPSNQLTLKKPTAVNTDRLLAVSLTDPQGAKTSLAALVRGRPAVVNFWQSSCAPCIDEMPLLEAAQARHPKLAFIGIATQDQVARSKKLAEQTKITYPWAQDPDGLLWHEAKGAGMPTTIVLGDDGTVIASKTGAFTSADELDAFLAKAGG